MSPCFSWILLAGAVIAVMVGMVRWFEQVADAVDQESWEKLALLVFVPPSVWMFRSAVQGGRLVPVPRYEPARGFGLNTPRRGFEVSELPMPSETAVLQASDSQPVASGSAAEAKQSGISPVQMPAGDDGPPPGTPKEFLGMPTIPPPKKSNRPAVDPDKLAKLKQKMREQGMLPPESKP
jgi:hypothetical protein